MNPRDVIGRYRRPLIALFVLCVGGGAGLGATSSDPLLAGFLWGILVGGWAFATTGLVFVALAVGGRSYVRLLRGVFLALVAFGIGGDLVGGRSFADAITFGFISGALAFIPAVTVLALAFAVYSVSTRRNRSFSHG
jgi:hypothetical protein